MSNSNPNNNWTDEMASFHHNNNHQQPRHPLRGQMSDYREKIPPNETTTDEGVVSNENEEIVDSEWEDFEKLLR